MPVTLWRPSAPLLVALGVCCGCATPAERPSNSPGFNAALTQICNVDKLAQLDPSQDVIGVDGARHDWLMSNVKDPDGIELITLLRVEANKRRATMLRDALGGSAESRCALADWYDHEG
jgi:hypothetical protein